MKNKIFLENNKYKVKIITEDYNITISNIDIVEILIGCLSFISKDNKLKIIELFNKDLKEVK